MDHFANISTVSRSFGKTPRYGGNGFGRGLNMLINYKRILEGTNADLGLGSCDWASVPILTGFAAYQIAKVSVCIEIRDVWPAALGDGCALSLESYVFNFRDYRVDRSDQIFSTLPFVGDHISESMGRAKDFQLIPNPMDLALCSPVPLKFKKHGHYKISILVVSARIMMCL